MKPTAAKPIPTNAKDAGSGVALTGLVIDTLSKIAPMLPGVLLENERAAVWLEATTIGTEKAFVSLEFRTNVELNKPPSETVVEVELPRCEPFRTNAMEITEIIIRLGVDVVYK